MFWLASFHRLGQIASLLFISSRLFGDGTGVFFLACFFFFPSRRFVGVDGIFERAGNGIGQDRTGQDRHGIWFCFFSRPFLKDSTIRDDSNVMGILGMATNAGLGFMYDMEYDCKVKTGIKRRNRGKEGV